MMSSNLTELVKKKKLEELQNAAYARKLNNQYEYLRKWDKGDITGIEAIEAIVQEEKVFRVENDLKTLRHLPALPTPPKVPQMDEIIFVDSKGKQKMKITGNDLVISDDKEKEDEDEPIEGRDKTSKS